MYEWLTDTSHIMNIVTACIALAFGASARTIKLLRLKKISKETSLLEWVDNQFTAIPAGIMALLVVPEVNPEIKQPVLLALMIFIGIFGGEVLEHIKTIGMKLLGGGK